MANETFEQRMQRACRDLEIPGAILIAGDISGKYRYEKAFGQRSLKNPGKEDPMQIDSTMWLASCTKLIGTIAALQCVERELVGLDDDVTGILPEVEGMKILKTGEGGEGFVLEERRAKMTLRHLITHTSGMTYDMFNPVMMQYRISQGFTPTLYVHGNVQKAFTHPLLSEPGELWEYSVGLDWAGWMVERVTGKLLPTYIDENIWAPLGVKDGSTFTRKDKSAIWDKLVDMSDRGNGETTMFGTPLDPEAKVQYTDNTIWNQEGDGVSAGAGGYAAPLDYQKILHSILANDGKLLKHSTVAEMFKPQISEAAAESLMQKLALKELNDAYGAVPMGAKVNWGLGGMLMMEDSPGGHKKGTLVWCGYPNLFWFIDPKGGVAGIYGSQVNPTGDPKSGELKELWLKEEVYKKADLKL